MMVRIVVRPYLCALKVAILKVASFRSALKPTFRIYEKKIIFMRFLKVAQTTPHTLSPHNFERL